MKIFGFSGWSGSGKTTLIESLIPAFTARGLTTSVVKHTHHGFDLDKPGKDSFRFRAAGAGEVMLAGDQRWALMRELPEGGAALSELLARLAPCDLVLVEGFKTVELPKIEVYRPSLGKPLACLECPNLVAIASDVVLETDLPLLDLNDPAAIAACVLQHTGLG